MMIQNIEDQQLPHNQKTRSSLGYKFSKKYASGLIVQSQDRSSSLTLATPVIQDIRQCRICLDSEQNDENKLVSPCQCTGSVKYVHDKCYRKWIDRQFQSKDQKQKKTMINKGVQCQLCKYQICLIFQHQCQCMKFARFKVNYNQNKLVFFLLLFLLVINFGCLGYISYFCAGNNINLNSYLVTFIVIICAYVFLTVTASLGTYYLINDFMIEKIWILDSFSGSQPQIIIKKNNVYPESSIQQIY